DVGTKKNFSLKAGIDFLFVTSRLESFQGFATNFGEKFPSPNCPRGIALSNFASSRKEGEGEEARMAGGLGGILQDLSGGEDEDGRSETNQGAGDFIDHSLRGAARLIVRSFRVEAVLQDIVIESAEVHDAIVVDRVIDAVKLIIRVPFAALFHELRSAFEHPKIPFFELIVGDAIS